MTDQDARTRTQRALNEQGWLKQTYEADRRQGTSEGEESAVKCKCGGQMRDWPSPIRGTRQRICEYVDYIRVDVESDSDPFWYKLVKEAD